MSRRTIFAAVKTCLAILLVAYLFRSGKLQASVIMELFRPSRLPFAVLAGGLFLSSQAAAAERLKLLLGMGGIEVPYREVFRLTMVGNFFNNVLPGMVGGDFVKGVHLTGRERERKGRSAGIIVLDRLFGLAAILIFATLATVYLLRRYGPRLGAVQQPLYWALTLAAAALLTAATGLLLGKRPAVRALAKSGLSRALGDSFLYYAAHGLASAAKSYGVMARALLFSFATQLLCLTAVICLGAGLPQALPPIVDLAAASSVIFLFGLVPLTPGNIGWTEFVAGAGCSALGSQGGAALFLAWRIVAILCCLPWGLRYLLRSRASTLTPDG